MFLASRCFCPLARLRFQQASPLCLLSASVVAVVDRAISHPVAVAANFHTLTTFPLHPELGLPSSSGLAARVVSRPQQLAGQRHSIVRRAQQMVALVARSVAFTLEGQGALEQAELAALGIVAPVAVVPQDILEMEALGRYSPE
jgi:hypothetical protein